MRFYNQIDAVGTGSTAIDIINATVSPVPMTPATLSAISTMSQQGPVQIRNMTILNRETVNSIISQQSATNATLSEAQKLAKGIVPGTAGATLQQLTRPGLQIKPGSAEFIQQKMNMGMKFEKAMSPALITGNLGVRTVNDVVRNTNSQVTAVAAGLKDSANSLINKGIISGLEPSTQIGGIIAAASVFGNQTIGAILKDPKNVVNILSNRGTEIVGNISSGITSGITNLTSTITGGIDKLKDIGNMISSGNFASGIADKFSSGLSGVAAGLSGAVAGAVGKFVGGLFGKSSNISIAQLFNQLKSTAQQAFISAENSLIGKLKPDQPNYLGNNVMINEETELQKAMNRLEAAKLDLEEAQRESLKLLTSANDPNLTEAEKNLRLTGAAFNTGASESLVRLWQRDVDLAKARVELETRNVISSTTPKKRSLFGSIKDTVSNITGQSSIPGVPGGLGAFANIGQFGLFKTAITAYTTGGLSLLAAKETKDLLNPTKLGGELLANTKTAFSNLEQKIPGASAFNAKLGGLLGSVKKTSGVMTPTYATNTDEKLNSQMASKTAALIESSIVPSPFSLGEDTIDNEKPNAVIAKQQATINQIAGLEAEKDKQELIVAKLYAESVNNPQDAGKTKSLASAREKLKSIDNQIATAQTAYYASIKLG